MSNQSSNTNTSSISEEELIIFISCLGGVLGLVFVIALVGFCWEHCKNSRSRKNRRRETLLTHNSKTTVNVSAITQSHPNDQQNRFNHYPSWLYDTMLSEQVQSMKNYLESGNENRNSVTHDPVHYINEVFSDIYGEDDAIKDKQLAVGYKKANKMIKPERKPTLPVPYFKDEFSLNKNEERKEKRKISLEKEFVEPHKENTSAGKILPLDDIDLDLFEMDDNGSEKEFVKVMIPKDLTVGEKIKARKQQFVEYENPTIMEKERREKRKEEEEIEEKKPKRIAMDLDLDLGFNFQASIPDFKPSGTKNRISEKEVIFDSVKQNQTKDSFLY